MPVPVMRKGFDLALVLIAISRSWSTSLCLRG